MESYFLRCNLRDFPDKVINDPDFLHLLTALVPDFLTFRTKKIKPAAIHRFLHRQQQVSPDAFIFNRSAYRSSRESFNSSILCIFLIFSAFVNAMHHLSSECMFFYFSTLYTFLSSPDTFHPKSPAFILTQ